jgi:hypothetical protein
MESRLLTRIDALLALFGFWTLGTLLLFSVALMMFDLLFGVLALAIVVVLAVATGYVFVGFLESIAE